MDFEVVSQRLPQRGLAEVSLDRLVTREVGCGQQIIDEFWGAARDNSESISCLVFEARVSQVEDNVTSLLARTFTIQDVILRQL